MSSYNISIMDKEGNYGYHDVSYDVYIYIKQLESYINYPEVSKLREVYKERFKTRDAS